MLDTFSDYIYFCSVFRRRVVKNDSLNSVTLVEDGFYTMNYTYDYDIDKLIEEGVSSHVHQFER